MDVDLVAVDADLINEVGGATKLTNIIPKDQAGSAKKQREAALEDVLLALSRRTPPINESSIARASDLKRAVVYGALERLYRAEMHEGDDHFATQRRIYAGMYMAELASVMPLLVDGGRAAPPTTIAFSRR